MKKIIASILILTSLVYATNGDMNGKKHMKMFQSVPVSKAIILQKGKAKMFCSICGMTLPMFYRTNHAATSKTHTKQYCSIHCLMEDKIKNGANLKNIRVVDNKTLKFIDVHDATYVVGSSKKGTMSMKSKYAFAKKRDAVKFADKFGGKVMNYAQTSEIAKKGLAKEMAMISKKQAKMAKKGKMIYHKMCKKTKLKFISIADAKAFVKESKICGNLSGKKLQAVGLYLGRR